jgi:putative intracellular protease/amidase
MTKALILITSASELEGQPTGWWLEEVAAPYARFQEAGYEVDIASTAGGAAKCDDKSTVDPYLTEDTAKFLADQEAQKKVTNSLELGKLKAEDYNIFFAAGGYGACVDFPNNDVVTSFVSKVYANGGVVASVCHGPNALIGAVGEDGEPIVKGKAVAGFTNEEEAQIQSGGGAKPTFYLEDKFAELGGTFEKTGAWGAHAVADGRLVTGQNPQSSSLTAEKAIAAYKATCK